MNALVGRCDSIKKGEIHLRCTVLKTKARRETIRRVKVATKSPSKGADTVLRVFRAKRFIYLLGSRYNKIIEMQYFM